MNYLQNVLKYTEKYGGMQEYLYNKNSVLLIMGSMYVAFFFFFSWNLIRKIRLYKISRLLSFEFLNSYSFKVQGWTSICLLSTMIFPHLHGLCGMSCVKNCQLQCHLFMCCFMPVFWARYFIHLVICEWLRTNMNIV